MRSTRDLIASAWPVVLAGIVGLGLCLSNAWHALELKTFDWLTVRTAPGEVPLPITIVAVDEESMAAVGKQWPWPRGIHAQLLARLKEAGAAVAAFDIVFAEPDAREDEDAAFARAIHDFGPVVLASNLEYRETRLARQWVRIDPRPQFLDAGATSALAAVKIDADGFLRKVPVSQGTFWLEVISRFDRVHPGIARNVSITEDHRIRYLGRAGTFSTIPYYRLLDPDKLLSPNWKDVLRDNIVLVGRVLTTAPDLNAIESDMFLTPFFTRDGQLMPGVEVQANIIADMMTGDALREAPVSLSMLLVVVVTAVAWFAMTPWHPWKSGVWMVATVAIVGGLDGYLFREQRLWLPAAAAVMTMVLAYAGQGVRGFLDERSRRVKLRAAFSQYVSPAVVDEIVADPQMLKLGGDRREITILFTDLAGFTTISEALPAESVAKLLNRHLAEMTEIVIRHQGTLDKFIGDAVMAFWGAPIPDTEQSRHALQAAVDMQKAVAAMRAELSASGGPAVHMRIGLHRGECIVGNMGGTKRFDYTAIGDAVNLASRLERVNNAYGTEVLVSAAVADAVGAVVPLRPVDTVRVKGKKNEVQIFTLCDDAVLIERSVAALDAYRRGDWSLAVSRWRILCADYPDDRVGKVFLARLEGWSERGWPDPWDGISEMESK